MPRLVNWISMLLNVPAIVILLGLMFCSCYNSHWLQQVYTRAEPNLWRTNDFIWQIWSGHSYYFYKISRSLHSRMNTLVATWPGTGFMSRNSVHVSDAVRHLSPPLMCVVGCQVLLSQAFSWSLSWFYDIFCVGHLSLRSVKRVAQESQRTLG